MRENLIARLRPYWQRVLVYKGFVISLIFYYSLIALLSLIPALLQRKIFDYAIPNRDLRGLGLILTGVITVNILVFLLNIGGDTLLTQLTEDNRFRLKRDLFGHMLRLPYPFYDRVSLGEVHKVMGDSGQLSELPRLTILELFKNLFVVVTYYPILFILNSRLALIRLAGFPLEFLLGRMFLERDRKLEKEIWQKQGRLTSLINESYLGMRTLKSLGGESESVRKFRIAHLDMKSSLIRRRRNNYNWSMVSNLLNNLFSSLVFFWAARDIIHGHFTFGAFIAFNIINSQASRSLSGLAGAYKNAANMLNPLERYESVRLLDKEQDYTGGRIMPTPSRRVPMGGSSPCLPSGHIKIRDLSFSYAKGDPALQNINMNLPAGTHTALVGPSGSGKTTLVNLLLRLYLPGEGTISLDGRPLNNWSVESLRRSLAVVQQETFLFEATLRENLIFGLGSVDDRDIWRALEKAHAAGFLRRLPRGLDSFYGTGGVRFSGGQKQRLAVARLFLRDPKVIILDEATSSQDLEGERLIQDALARLSKGRTTVSIAHRLNTVARADRIYVLNEGRIVETGRHKELISQKGLYARLFANMRNFYG